MNENKKAKIIFDAEPKMRTIDSNGYMHVKLTPISKACVNPYLGSEIPNGEAHGYKPDEIYYALRDPDELKKATGTFNGLPLLMDHHEINADNPAKQFQVGSTGTDAVFDGKYLKNSLSITDSEAIKAIEDGSAKEISCAYAYDADFTPGEFEGVPYDFVMRNIRGNHVALVAEGRAGHDVKVADSISKVKEKLEMEKKKVEEKKKSQQKAMDENTVPETNKVPTPAPGEDEIPEGVERQEAPKSNDEPQKTEDSDEEVKINTDSDDYKAGYVAGLKASQDTGGEKQVDKITGDSLEKVKERAKMEAIEHVRKLSKAAKECEFAIGRQDALAFDSATDIYELALKQKGFDTSKYPKAAYASMVAVLGKQENKGIANDSNIPAVDEELPDTLKGYLD